MDANPRADTDMDMAFPIPAPADDLRASVPRLSKADLLVIMGGVLLLVAGWSLKTWHDGRMAPGAAADVSLQRPADWFPLPAIAPAVAQWIAPDGSGATLTVYAAPGAEEVSAFSGAGAAVNPATARPAYSPLGSGMTTVDGQEAVETEYAYALNFPSDPAPPIVIRGRQVSWLAGERQLVLALEAPEASWGAVERFYPAIVGSVAGE